MIAFCKGQGKNASLLLLLRDGYKNCYFDYNGFQLIEKNCNKHILEFGPGPVSVSVSLPKKVQ